MNVIHDTVRGYIRNFFSFFLLVVGGILFFACSDDSEGIFYSLEQEEKAVDNSLPNSVVITGDMLKETIDSEERYYVCAGSLFYRTVTVGDTTHWRKIKSPIDLGIVSGLAKVGGDIFVSVSNGSKHGLFRLNSTGTSYETVNLYNTREITRLFALNGNLFASAGTPLDDTPELLWWNGTNLVPTGITQYLIKAGAWDGTNYWFAGPSDLFQCTSLPGENSWSSVTPFYSYGMSSPPSSELEGKTYFTDLFADPDYPGTLYLCSSDGYILKTEDSGTTWISSSDHNKSFKSITKAAGMIILGAGTSVIRELPNAILEDDLNTIERPGGNFSRLPDLYESNVIRVFGFGDILFGGTTRNGLWRGDYSTDVSSPVWSQE
ncbi:MAG TPA: hypothetical protein PLG79_07130 [Spirochaetales bacterium]|nr:hypothetical protein [Spirochaetales bacterium]